MIVSSTVIEAKRRLCAAKERATIEFITYVRDLSSEGMQSFNCRSKGALHTRRFSENVYIRVMTLRNVLKRRA